MNAKLCKRIRHFLRLTEVPKSAGFHYEHWGKQRRNNPGTALHPAGTFERENTKLKRFAKSLNAADRAKAFPNLRSPF